MQFNKNLIDNHPNHYFERRNLLFFHHTDAQDIKIDEFSFTVIVGTVLGDLDAYRKLFNNKT